MTQPVSCANVSGFASELAVLLLENESNQSASARLERDAARQSYLDEAQQQVDALHAAADAIGTGAIVSAALTVGGGLFEMGGASAQYRANVDFCPLESASDQRSASLLGAASKVAAGLAPALGAIIGDSTAEAHKADAKSHETLASQAQWQASDASSQIDKAEKQADKVLALVESIQRDQNASTNSLIGRI